MALGLYKAGQGYWIRVITAAAAATVLVAAAAWCWQQAGAIQLPIGQRSMTVSATVAQTPPAPGQTMTLLGATSDESIGTANVRQYTPIGGALGTLVLDKVRMNEGVDFNQATRVRGPDPTAYAANISADSRVAIPIIEPIYLQAGVVGVLLAIGGWLVYWLVGVKKGTVEFLIATDGEMKKVNWSSRKDIIGSTWVVIIASLLIAASLFVVDVLFAQFFELIGVLER